jgi:catechol 2,3-dioxygenase-like lactoylglutathione lyase family enzyme
VSQESPHLTRLDHVQLALPVGSEDAARRFYGDLLCLAELQKPPLLAARGGVWFEGGPIVLHLGVEADFRPARKAHPAFRVRDLRELRERLSAAGVAIVEDHDLPGERRFYAADPFGNRLEFMAERASQEN